MTRESATLESWPRIAEILDRALDLPPAERAAFVAEAAGGDPALAAEAQALVAAAAEAGDFLETPVGEIAAELLAEPGDGDHEETLEWPPFGPYQLVRQIGGGGMGEVYEAFDPRLARRVALKLLPARSRDPDAKERFVREARAAAAVDHPHLCSVYDVGEAADGRLFLVMAYYQGETLAEKIARGPLPVAEARAIAVQVARGLEAAHQAGIVHRDVKPSNVMLTEHGETEPGLANAGRASPGRANAGRASPGRASAGRASAGRASPGRASAGRAKILDFGVARIAGSVSLTRTGSSPGTPAYMSPEQIRADPTDVRTDVWSLGVVLYEMLAGRRPFAEDSWVALTHAILERPPEPIERVRGEVSTALARVVARALAKDPGERYRTITELLADLETGAVPALPAVRQRWRRIAAAVLLVAALLATGWWFSGAGRPPAPADIDSIAVLPFENVGGDPDAEYLSDGLAEALIYHLAQIEDLRVAPRSAAFRYRGQAIDAGQVGGELDVRSLVMGRVEQRGEELAISVDLTDLEDQRQLWGAHYRRRASDLLAVRREIALAISLRLRPRLTSTAELVRRETESTEAFRLYLRGRFHFNRRTAEGLGQAIDDFRQAIALDPAYARAYAGLADAHVILSHWGAVRPSEAYPRAAAAVRKALALDDSLAEAHTAYGVILHCWEWDWEGAEAVFRRAIELDPDYPFAFHIYGATLSSLGRHEEAIALVERALELDPLSPMINTVLVRAHVWARRPERAIEEAKRTLKLHPGFPPTHHFLGEAYAHQGRYEEAIVEYRQDQSPLSVFGLASALAGAGRTAEAEEILNDLVERSAKEYVEPSGVAQIYAALGRKEEAFRWLAKAFEEHAHSLTFVHEDADFDSLRSDPRFQDLFRRMRYPGYAGRRVAPLQ